MCFRVKNGNKIESIPDDWIFVANTLRAYRSALQVRYEITASGKVCSDSKVIPIGICIAIWKKKKTLIFKFQVSDEGIILYNNNNELRLDTIGRRKTNDGGGGVCVCAYFIFKVHVSYRYVLAKVK